MEPIISVLNFASFPFLIPKVQKTASSAVKWLRKHGGQSERDDLVCRLSKVGASGAHPNNSERDVHRLLSKMSLSVGAAIEKVKVRMWNPSSLEESWELLPMLFPDSLLIALWDKGEKVFRKCLFGDMTEKDAESFWRHMDKVQPWYRNLPSRAWKHKGKMASIGVYGDEIECYKNSECGVVSVTAWTAEFAMRSPPLLRYYAVAAWSEHCESKHTYADMEQHLAERLRMLSDPLVEWPWSASGYHIAVTFVQGDLKWIVDRMNGLHNFRRNDFCSRCFCVKTDDDVRKTLPNFCDQDPDTHQARAFSADELRNFSSLLGLPGMCVERVMHDIVHSQYLGTGKTTNGASDAQISVSFLVSLP